MLSLEIRLLTGRLAAAALTDAGTPEWPPQPARVYSALTAALHDAPEPHAAEVRALEWLAAAGAPDVIASDADRRHIGSVYVPTNDQKALSDIDTQLERLAAAEQDLAAAVDDRKRSGAARAVEQAREQLRRRSIATARDDARGNPAAARELVDRRVRPQPRHFPAAIPHDPVVHLCWDVTVDRDTLAALDRVAGRVARLGHSSSLVSMRFIQGAVDRGQRRRWVPSEDGDVFLRVPLDGQLDLLRDEHARHGQVEARVLPARFARYAVAEGADEPPAAGTTFADGEREWIVFEVVAPPEGGRRNLLDLSLAQRVARAMRGLLFNHIDLGRSPASLTGHAADGSPARVPHLAYVPLADVGHPHATGSILGLALVPPLGLAVESRDLLLEAIHRAEAQASQPDGPGAAAGDGPPALRLTLGRSGVLHVQRLRDPSPTRALQPERWTRAARRWHTATPVALGRNPGNLRSRDPAVAARAVEQAERTVMDDCRNLGLPEPAAVHIHARSLLGGAPAAARFMPFPDDDGGGPRRVCVHAEIVFDRPVRGPLLVGAGRFFGIGLCAPVSTRADR
jgi:CRISPR-associated protein Csb2